MAEYLKVRSDNPEIRWIKRAVEVLREGGIIVYPTDSTYAIGCQMGDKKSLERIRALRRLDPKHNLTLLCADLSELSSYSQVSNAAYRILKSHTPGPFTFLLKATPEVPRRLQHPKRKTIGLRIPSNTILRSLILASGEPIMSTSLILAGQSVALSDPEEFRTELGSLVDLIIDGGVCGEEPSTVIDLIGSTPELVREGCGASPLFKQY